MLNNFDNHNDIVIQTLIIKIILRVIRMIIRRRDGGFARSPQCYGGPCCPWVAQGQDGPGAVHGNPRVVPRRVAPSCPKLPALWGS